MKKALDGEQNEASKMLLADVQEVNDLGVVHYISNAQVAAIDTLGLAMRPINLTTTKNQ